MGVGRCRACAVRRTSSRSAMGSSSLGGEGEGGGSVVAPVLSTASFAAGSGSKETTAPTRSAWGVCLRSAMRPFWSSPAMASPQYSPPTWTPPGSILQSSAASAPQLPPPRLPPSASGRAHAMAHTAPSSAPLTGGGGCSNIRARAVRGFHHLRSPNHPGAESDANRLRGFGATTKGPMWGYPRPVLGAVDTFLEPFRGVYRQILTTSL
jgi:hypothetical protein